MEKFAERYCRDNPGAFRSADGAYLLAFALIMLNTDAHNPHADGSLGPADFVGMCQAQVWFVSAYNHLCFELAVTNTWQISTGVKTVCMSGITATPLTASRWKTPA